VGKAIEGVSLSMPWGGLRWLCLVSYDLVSHQECAEVPVTKSKKARKFRISLVSITHPQQPQNRQLQGHHKDAPFKIPFLTNPSGPSRPCKNPSNLSFFCAVSKSCFLPAKASPGCPSRICLSCNSPGEGREEMCDSRLDVAEEG
jgi:hypothetical protein